MGARVLLLTQWFEPEPTFKGLAFARELVRQGFEVDVVTGFPNYPGGRVYPGYHVKLMQREMIDGVNVTRVPLYASHDQSGVKRALNYCSFAVSALIYGLFVARRPDVIYAYHPPLTIGMAAGAIRLLRHIPVVYDVQDMWPDTLQATGMVKSRRVLSVIGALCNWVYRRVDHIAVQSPGFKNLLVQRGVPGSKVDVIYNWADEQALAAAHGQLPDQFPASDKFRILFAGNMGTAQALDSVLDAAALLQERNSRICFVLMGGGVAVERLKARVRNLNLRNVVFLPSVPMSDVGTFLRGADALLVHLKKDPLFRVTVPSKTQAYLAAGKPVLMAVEGDAATLLALSGSGLVIESENPAALADAALTLERMPSEMLAEHGRRAQQYYENELSIAAGVAKFGTIFRSLAAGQGVRT